MFFSDFKNNFCLNNSVFEPLFLLNNVRFDYILNRIDLKNKRILDLGCGLGILSQKLALHGGIVTAVDKSEDLIFLANKNLNIKSLNLNINYMCFDFFLSKNFDSFFDIIICTEVLEHLYDKIELLNLINKYSKKNTLVFLSSLNKNFFSYFKIIFLGEFISFSLAKNTHKFDYFINLDKFRFYLKNFNFSLNDVKYLDYNFLFKYSNLDLNGYINYFIEFTKIS